MAFAGLPQVSRRCSWRLRDSRKSHGDTVDVCGTPASLTEMQLAFAGLLQTPRKYGWHLQECCKCHGNTVGICRNAANATEIRLAFAGTLQVPRKYGWHLQECCKHQNGGNSLRPILYDSKEKRTKNECFRNQRRVAARIERHR